jgi:hypothetical protein
MSTPMVGARSLPIASPTLGLDLGQDRGDERLEHGEDRAAPGQNEEGGSGAGWFSHSGRGSASVPLPS